MLVGQDEHRRLECISEIERPERFVEALFGVAWREHHPKEVPLRSVEAEPQVALGRSRREPGGRAGALTFDDDQRDFGRSCEAEPLDHERKAPPRGRYH